MKEYRFVGEQEYEITVTYDLGGCSRNYPRGYRLRIIPVERKELCITYTYTFEEDERELRVFLLEVKRKSDKKEKEAIEIAKPLIENHFKKLEEKFEVIS